MQDVGLASQGQIPWAPNFIPYSESSELPIASQLWLLLPYDSTTPKASFHFTPLFPRCQQAPE